MEICIKKIITIVGHNTYTPTPSRRVVHNRIDYNRLMAIGTPFRRSPLRREHV